ncbi:MAG: hypothetical protein K9M03_02810 [Kiritimatiellales bacterium]|nr:hypothetical protein [Kiritimatiellales bacterium]
MKKFLIPCSLCLLFILGCTPPEQPPVAKLPTETEPDIAMQNEEEPPIRETKNVIYQGIVKPSGISIYMQGSHRLQLEDGKFILLESDTVDLNGYVNEKVELLGALRPTVEAGGMIMRVEQASLVVEDESEPEDELNEESSDDDSEELPPADDTIASNDEENTEEVEEEPNEPSVPPSTEPEELPPPETEVIPEEEESIEMSPELMARTEVMAAENFSSENWTQQYCTGHIGFCIPIHRNWWFKSFGATISYLWHIELSAAELNKLNDGPIHINLVSGTIGSKKATDKQVREQGGQIVGYRTWIDNRHFEIKAPLELEEAVRYITENLEEYVE